MTGELIRWRWHGTPTEVETLGFVVRESDEALWQAIDPECPMSRATYIAKSWVVERRRVETGRVAREPGRAA